MKQIYQNFDPAATTRHETITQICIMQIAKSEHNMQIASRPNVNACPLHKSRHESGLCPNDRHIFVIDNVKNVETYY